MSLGMKSRRPAAVLGGLAVFALAISPLARVARAEASPEPNEITVHTGEAFNIPITLPPEKSQALLSQCPTDTKCVIVFSYGRLGNGSPLPSWLAFSGGHLKGSPPAGSTGTVGLRLTAMVVAPTGQPYGEFTYTTALRVLSSPT